MISVDYDQPVRVITGNLASATSWASEGSRLYPIQITPERLRCLVRSRSGRWIDRWVPLNKMRGLRMVDVYPSHPAYDQLRYLSHTDELLASLTG